MRAFAFSLENQMNVFFKVLKPCLNPSVKRETKKTRKSLSPLVIVTKRRNLRVKRGIRLPLGLPNLTFIWFLGH